MSSDEDDYMSEKFIDASSSSVRPGLIKDRKIERVLQITAKKRKQDNEQKDKFKSRKIQEQERLEEGLQNAIGSNNKGFAMLSKMGYKAGQAIGKTSQGITEPIGIKVKIDRGGLGREAAIKQLEEEKSKIKSQRLLQLLTEGKQVSVDEFRKRLTQKSEERQIESDLGKCQRACEKLDMDHNFDQPINAWFWPDRKQQKTESEEESEAEAEVEEDEIEFEPAEKLQMINNYLRTYNYCHWCGTQYENEKDLENCPGLNKDDH